jgi:twitching motility protein PilT
VIDLSAVLRFIVEREGSDVHLKAGSIPRARIDGQLIETEFDKVTPEDLQALVQQILPADKAAEFATTNEADFALSVPTIEELGLPPVVARLAAEHRGLVLVTGPTGSGKTSTLASMIDHINANQAVNIVTIEDPIEVIHRDQMAFINQREIGTDTHDYPQAMRRVLRQDPDVILIGEMRDAETVSAALSAAETGHMVFSTLHTTNAAETVNRIIDFFPPFQQHQIRLILASCLKGVISQRLLERAEGGGRVPAVEVMVTTGRIADRIIDPDGGQGETIEELIAEGEWYGMQTFDQSLFSLYKNGLVTLPDAMAGASNPHDFRLSLQQAGLVAAG